MNLHLEQLKLTIRNAWLTLRMLPDPDARFRRAFGSAWTLPVVQEARDAYGATPASWLGTPTAHEISEMETVFDWLLWLLKVEGDVTGKISIRRIAAWSMGQPVWKMAQRERCSEKTIHNRIDRSIAKISGQFKSLPVKMEVVDEAEQAPERIRGFAPVPERPVAGTLAEPGKVYIGGEGFRIHGEKYRSSYDVGEVSRGKRR
jgi:hypothetical protein